MEPGALFKSRSSRGRQHHSDVIQKWNDYLNTENVHDRPCNGHPYLITPDEDYHLRVIVCQNREMNTNELSTGKSISLGMGFFLDINGGLHNVQQDAEWYRLVQHFKNDNMII